MTKEAIEQYDRLVDAIYKLDHRIIELESDIYDMQKKNSEMRRRVNDLESSKSMRMPPF